MATCTNFPFLPPFHNAKQKIYIVFSGSGMLRIVKYGNPSLEKPEASVIIFKTSYTVFHDTEHPAGKFSMNEQTSI